MIHALNIVPPSNVLEDLFEEFQKAWGVDTTSNPENWFETRPEVGQCAVTALIVQDIFGGELVRGVVNGESHYWNSIPNWGDADLTRSQFNFPLTIENIAFRTREYVLSNELTAQRYEILKTRMKY